MWYIPDEFLPSGLNIKQSIDPEIKDECHYNLIGLSNKQAELIFSKVWNDIGHFSICDDKGERPLTREDILEWQRKNPT